MTTTTADWRNEAQRAEKALEWGRAMDAWQRAIEAYPNRTGQLAKRDLEQMERRRVACQREYFPA